MCQKVGGHTEHVIFVLSDNRTNINELYLRMYGSFTHRRTAILCQFIEIVHKIINWYMKNAK